MKTTRPTPIGIILAAFILAASGLFAQDEPLLFEEPVSQPALIMSGMIEGTGTAFELTDSDYLDLSLNSSEQIELRLESVPEMIVMNIEAAEGASSTLLTLCGFTTSTTYYKYEDI